MKMTATLPDHAAVVNAMLDGFVQACAVIVASGLAPPDPTMVSGVVYQLEPAGEEDWKLPTGVMRDGWGDCEDLAGWRAAGLRVTGEDPSAKCVVVKTGPGKLHAVVLRSTGEIDDVCLELMQLGRAKVPMSEISGLGLGAKKHKPMKVHRSKDISRDGKSISQREQEKQDQQDQQTQQMQQTIDQLQQQASSASAAQQAAPASAPQGMSYDPSEFYGGGGFGGGGDVDPDLSANWDRTLSDAFEV